MNEIEELYKNVGIEKVRYCTKIGNCHYQECPKCDYYNYIYPPFTAKKQIELIKWLARKDYGNYAESLLISIRDSYNYLSCGITTDFGSECFYEDFTSDDKQFEEALAGLVNKLWKNLTEEEKERIRGILE